MEIDDISINRTPVLTLWAAIVAERLGFNHDEALTLGRAVAGLNAYWPTGKIRRKIGLSCFLPMQRSQVESTLLAPLVPAAAAVNACSVMGFRSKCESGIGRSA